MSGTLFYDELIKTCKTILVHVQSTLNKVKESIKENDGEPELNASSSLVTVCNPDEFDLFSPSEKVNVLFTEAAQDVQKLVSQLRHEFNYDQVTYNYFLDFLYEFHFVDDRFVEPFSVDILSIFEQKLPVFIQSIEAFNGAEKGDITMVKTFLTEDPFSKDRPLLHGYTLLYVATANNHLDVIKYLIEEAKCSVNAQNQNDKCTDVDTALHAACIKGHADIVRYLLSQGANCYIENKNKETPTMIANNYADLHKIFSDHLVLDYTGKCAKRIDLPTMTIQNKLLSINYDLKSLQPVCVWEFKLLHEQNWQYFDENESGQLNTSLRDKSDTNINVSRHDGAYSVSMMKFLVEDGTDQNVKWIRCRGSNLYNFDVQCLWQMMLISHPSVSKESHKEAKTKPVDIPALFDSNQLRYRLNSWYNADDITGNLFDDAIDQRVRYCIINTRLFGKIHVNLELFSFNDETKTIQGYIRWIPKFVNVDSRTKRIKPIDNFQTTTFQNDPPIPLRNKLLRELSSTLTTSNDLSDITEYNVAADDLMADVPDRFIDNATEDKEEEIESTQMSVVVPTTDVELNANSDDETSHDVSETTDSSLVENLQNNIRETRQNLDRELARIKQYDQIVERERTLLKDLESKKKDIETKESLIRQLCDSLSNPPISEDFLMLQNEYDKQEKIFKSAMNEMDQIKQRCRELEQNLKNEQTQVQLLK
ncbi:unnamed protein product, partial [Adineta ricciae]